VKESFKGRDYELGAEKDTMTESFYFVDGGLSIEWMKLAPKFKFINQRVLNHLTHQLKKHLNNILQKSNTLH
jgi:hypothetical protein